MDLNAITDFHLIAASGGFGAASRASGRSKATLSRRLADLEETLGVRLIERSNRRLEITEAGKLLLARTAGALREISEAVVMAQEGATRPSGCLRIAAPLLFSQVALGQLTARFRTRYPDVRIESVAEDRLSNLVEEHFDVAIRINPPPHSTLVGRCFARDKLILVAAPGFEMPLSDDGRPLPVAAVVMPTHREGEIWSLDNGRRCLVPRPVAQFSSLLAVRDVVTAGAGAAMLPQSIVSILLEKGALIAWGEANETTELWVLHTSRRLQSPKVSAFVAFICEQYPGGWFTA
ncbi:LysR family transcriptional regulator [Pantoea septica]|uniref:LysR family transcriptional regulator n=1 Tax=Pantoea septica TaxID=472695 RepID=UPI001C0FE2BD|nr:LysR family transcriptional regulator [Pantoea septica]MBU5379188.1 LysR family transcriptional regulator [Pantoea septica]